MTDTTMCDDDDDAVATSSHNISCVFVGRRFILATFLEFVLIMSFNTS